MLRINLGIYSKLLTLLQFILFLSIFIYAIWIKRLDATVSDLMESSNIITIIMSYIIQVRSVHVIFSCISETNVYKRVAKTFFKSLYLFCGYVVTYLPISKFHDPHIIFTAIAFSCMIIATSIEQPILVPIQLCLLLLFLIVDLGSYAEYTFMFIDIIRQFFINEDCSIEIKKIDNQKQVGYVVVSSTHNSI